MEDDTGPHLDLSHAALDIIVMVLGSMPLRDRCICALVCKAWAEAAAAATHSIILKQVQDLSGLQHWLEKHGDRLEVLQLHTCCEAALAALPCCAKLQDLLLHGFNGIHYISIASRTWIDIASATRLTSLSLKLVQTTSQQADVVSALTALPNLEQLTCYDVLCSGRGQLSDSSLLQQMTRLTSLDLHYVTAAALQHLGSLTKLQHLWIGDAQGWGPAGCPGLPELQALTSLQLSSWDLDDLPASISQLTALRQLVVHKATPTALNRLQVLTGLTHLCVWEVTGLSPESPPLKLPGLQHLQLPGTWRQVIMPMSFLASCTQLQHLRLQSYHLKGPGSLVASTMLQHLELYSCSISAADGAAGPVSWQQLLPGPGQLPHLTSLELVRMEPPLQQADIESAVLSSSNLKVLRLDRLCSSCAPALARLPGLTSLRLHYTNDEEWSAMVQLTGLRQLTVIFPLQVSAVGLRQLAALQQLTSLGLGYFDRSPLDTVAQHLMRDDLPDCFYGIANKVCIDVASQQERCVFGCCSDGGGDGEGRILCMAGIYVCRHSAFPKLVT